MKLKWLKSSVYPPGDLDLTPSVLSITHLITLTCPRPIKTNPPIVVCHQ